MYGDKELEQMLKLAGITTQVTEQDHDDLEADVAPQEPQEVPDIGIPDFQDVDTYEDVPLDTDDYGIPMDTTLPPEMTDEVPSMAIAGADDACGCATTPCSCDGGEVVAVGGVETGCECGASPCQCGGGSEMVAVGGDMTSQFANMGDDDFMAIIQGGIPDMNDKISEFDNEDGEESPVGSDDEEVGEDLIEYEMDWDQEISEEYDYSNGYGSEHMIDGEEYFPTGHDSNVRKKAGPVPKPADNNLNVGALPVDDTDDDSLTESLYNKYKADYEKFMKE